MPSRIDIGPEGGPFVAINENSNDLELQDINGNVIAVWDETEGQWDLNNNSLTNINAIDASSATLGKIKTSRSWQNKTNSREFNTVETNNSGSDIETRVAAEANQDNTQITLRLEIDGLLVDPFKDVVDNGDRGTVGATVPAGSDYEVRALGNTADYEKFTWRELRP